MAPLPRGDAAFGDGRRPVVARRPRVASLVLLDFFGYFVLLECLTGGRTVGKLASGLRAVRLDGRPIGFRRSVVRTVLRFIDYLTIGVGLASSSGPRATSAWATSPPGRSCPRAPGGARRDAWTSPSTWASVARGGTGRRPSAGRLGLRRAARRAGLGRDGRHAATRLVLAERFLRSRVRLHGRGAARASRRSSRTMLAPKVAGAPPGLEAERFLEGVVAAKTGGGWAVPGVVAVGAVRPTAGPPRALSQRRSAKNACSTSAHSSASTP